MDDRRNAERAVSPDFGCIMTPGERDLPCRAVDRSATGLRIVLHSAAGVPDAFTVVMLSTGETIPVVVAWRTDSQLGVRIAVDDVAFAA